MQRNTGHITSFIYDGVTYKNVRECCDALGISYKTVTRCLYVRDYVIDDAIKAGLEEAAEANRERKPRIAVAVPVTIDGVEYPSAGAACKAYGINKITSTAKTVREKFGLSPRESLEYAIYRKIYGNGKDLQEKFPQVEGTLREHRGSYTFRGVEYASKDALLRACHMSWDTLAKYMKLWDMDDMEAAIERYLSQRARGAKSKKTYTYKDKTYPTIKAACADLDLNYIRVRSRVDEGKLTFEQAVDYEIEKYGHAAPKNEQNNPIEVEYGGVRYSSIRQVKKVMGTDASHLSAMAKILRLAEPELTTEQAYQKALTLLYEDNQRRAASTSG